MLRNFWPFLPLIRVKARIVVPASPVAQRWRDAGIPRVTGAPPPESEGDLLEPLRRSTPGGVA